MTEMEELMKEFIYDNPDDKRLVVLDKKIKDAFKIFNSESPISLSQLGVFDSLVEEITDEIFEDRPGFKDLIEKGIPDALFCSVRRAKEEYATHQLINKRTDDIMIAKYGERWSRRV